MKYEDKQEICNLLLPALQATRGLYDLEKLDFDAHSETVTAWFPGGTTIINVAMDSGTAMIVDIMKRLA